MFRTNNPALRGFEDSASNQHVILSDSCMSVGGVVNKTLILLALLLLAAGWVWGQYISGQREYMGLFMLGGGIGGMVLGLVTAFKKNWAPVTTPMYAVLKGCFLGGISAQYELRFPGVVIGAISLSLAVLFCLLFAYKSGFIKVSEKFRSGVFIATAGIAVVYLLSFVLGLFGVKVPGIFDSGLIGIGFSLLVVGVASMNLLLDFDFIERAAASSLPRYMEWYGAFALLITLIWLYLEILRLLAKLNGRRR